MTLLVSACHPDDFDFDLEDIGEDAQIFTALAEEDDDHQILVMRDWLHENLPAHAFDYVVAGASREGENYTVLFCAIYDEYPEYVAAFERNWIARSRALH